MDVTLPTVVGSFGETPELVFPESDAPRGLHAVVLEEGTGPAVQAGREIEVDYLGQIWNGRVFDSSFRRGHSVSFPIGVRMVLEGWDQAIVGRRRATARPETHGRASAERTPWYSSSTSSGFVERSGSRRSKGIRDGERRP